MASTQHLSASSSLPELSTPAQTLSQRKTSRSCEILPQRLITSSTLDQAIYSIGIELASSGTRDEPHSFSEKTTSPRGCSSFNSKESSTDASATKKAPENEVMFTVSRLRPCLLPSTDQINQSNGNGYTDFKVGVNNYRNDSGVICPSFEAQTRSAKRFVKSTSPYLRKPLRTGSKAHIQRYSSIATDEGVYSSQSSVHKSSSYLSDFCSFSARRSSWSQGTFQKSPSAHNFRSAYSSSPGPRRFGGSSLVSLRTYYAFGAKSMPAVDKWAQRIPSYSSSWSGSTYSNAKHSAFSLPPLRTEIYSCFGLAPACSAAFAANSSFNLSSKTRETHWLGSEAVGYQMDNRTRSNQVRIYPPDTQSKIAPPATKKTETFPFGRKDASIDENIDSSGSQKYNDSILASQSDFALNSRDLPSEESISEMAHLVSKLKAENQKLQDSIQAKDCLIAKAQLNTKHLTADFEAKLETKNQEIVKLTKSNQVLATENAALKVAYTEIDTDQIKALESQIAYLEHLLADKEATESFLKEELRRLTEDSEIKIMRLKNSIMPQHPQSSDTAGADAEIASLSVIRQKLEGDLLTLQTEMESALLELKEREESRQIFGP